MRKAASFNSGAFRFALMIAGLFAIGSTLLLVVVERTIQSYAAEATAVGLKSETAILARELPDGGTSELIDTIAHRQASAIEQPFRYLLVDRRGTRLIGDLPMDAAHQGWGTVTFLDDRPLPGERGSPEELQRLGTRLGDGSLLIVATDTFDIQKLRRRVEAFTIWSGMAITLLALVGGYVIGGLLLRRLERVNRAVGRIMAGSISERLPPIGMSPEFDHLSRNLNLMLDRIGDLMEGLRQVSTDIAHDLRTPLTRLRHQLESLRDAPSTAVYEDGIDEALRQTDAILGIFRALLRIGTIEGGEGRQRLAAVDLSEIVDRVAQIYQPVAEDERKTLVVHVEPGLSVLGDAELLAQVFTNLLDNALKYTAIGARIVASVDMRNGGVAAVVADDGPGVPAEERGKILRRFYRVDASRHEPGAGLGLALVAAIAALHDAELVVEDNHPGLRIGLVFSAGAPGT